MKKTALDRIEKMEAILNSANEKLDDLENAIDALRNYQEEIRKLEAYYASEDWKRDFALDEAGRLPADLKRGVLSEDGVYDLLERNREALGRFHSEAAP